MSNLFTACGGSGPPDLDLSNGATDVFFDVLTLAGCALAETVWEQHLILHFADAQRWSRGMAGFDLADLPWTGDWPAQRAFLDRVIALALTRHGWDLLSYEPPYAIGYLTRFREMLAGFTPAPNPWPGPEWRGWGEAPDPALLARCDRHDLYAGDYGCRLCDPDVQPI